MKAERTKAAILQRAVDLASLEGLEGLTIGRLADELDMSKSGLFAHFGSKEELQLATIAAAQERFRDEVLRPAFRAPRGYPRLLALCRQWIDYVERGVFPGGCFFAAASYEFDGRPGAVRDAIQVAMDGWVEVLEQAIGMARDEGHFAARIDEKQLAFELNSIFFGVNFSYQLREDRASLRHALKAVETRLEAVRVKPKASRPRPPARRRSAPAHRRG